MSIHPIEISAPSLSFEEMTSNLTEIASAAVRKDVESSSIRLCVNTGHSRLYSCSSLKGKFARIRHLSLYKGGIPPRLAGVVEKTHLAFHQHLKFMLDQVKEYQKYLTNSAKVAAIKQSEAYVGIGKRVLEWNRVIPPFLKLLHQEKNPWLCNFLSEYIPAKHPPLFSCEPQMIMLKKVEKSILLHELTAFPIPLRALFLLSKGKDPVGEDEKDLQRWLVQFSKHASILKVNTVIDFLTFSCECFQGDNDGVPSLSKLLYGLVSWYHKGDEYSPFFFHFFLRPDKKHLAWRDNLKPGDSISCNGKTIILGSELGEKNCRRVFLIDGRADVVVVIAQNQAYLHIRQQIIGQDDRGFRPAKFFEVDQSGQCALIERLLTPLSEMEWTSDSANPSRKDLAILAPLVEQIKWMIIENFSPSKLKPQHIMFDQSGVLKHTQGTGEGPFNFPKYELFFQKCAKGNRWIFTYLMKETGLFDHPTTNFYHSVLEKTLNGIEFNISREASLNKIVNPSAIKQGKLLAKEILEMRNTLINMMKENLKREPTAEEYLRVNKKIIAVFRELKTASTIWPTIQSLVFPL